MIYRKANKEDISQLAKMRWEFQLEDGDTIPLYPEEAFLIRCSAFIETGMQDGKWIFWVAEENKEIIAHIALHIVENLPKPQIFTNSWGYLTNSYTKKNWRNKGIGSDLIQYLIEEAKKANVETMIVWPSEHSFSYYKRAGFTKDNDIMERIIEW